MTSSDSPLPPEPSSIPAPAEPPAVEAAVAKPAGGGGMATLAFILALIAIAQPWILRRHDRDLLTAPVPSPVIVAAAPEETQPPANPDMAEGLTALKSRLDAMETALSSHANGLTAQESEIQQLRASQQGNMDSATLHLFIASQQMRVDLLLGHPYATPLAVIDKLLPKTDAQAADRAAIFAALAPWSASGLPTIEKLTADYRALAPDLIRTTRLDAAQNPWQRIVAEIKNAVLIRPKTPDATPADKDEAALDAIGNALAAHDLAGARELADHLAADIQAQMKDWREEADRLFAAEQALGRLDDMIVAGTAREQ